MSAEKITSGLAVAHLYRRYQLPEWFAVHELKVGESSAWRTERRADFVAVRLWGGGFGPVLGFEIKVTRSDFLHEMTQPEKRVPLENACHACYFVAPRGVLEVDELPEGWGWIEVQTQGLRMRKESRHQKREVSPAFLHSVMKRLIDDRWHDRARRPAVYDIPKSIWKLAGLEVTPAQLIEAGREMFEPEIRKAHEEGRKKGEKWKDERNVDSSSTLKELTKALMDSGFSSWDAHDPNRVREILRAGFNKQANDGVDAIRDAIRFAERSLDRLLDAESKLIGAGVVK